MNKKITKILVFALAFALLLGASLAIVSSAESKPEIISKNIEYGEKFAIMYAVDASTVAEGAVTLNIYAEEPTADSKVIASYTKNAPETIKVHDVDTSAYVFITNGVAAKDLGDFFYAQAIDAKGNKSDVVKYSVVEYMLERLYGGATITADQEEMYRKSLEFGEAAQELLSPDDEIQVADYKYVRVEGGTVNGVEKGIFLKGDALTLALNTAVPQGGFFFGWNNVNGATTPYAKNEFTLSESAVITADVVTDGSLGYFDNYGGYDFTGWTNNTAGTPCFDLNRCPTMNIVRNNGYMSIAAKEDNTRLYVAARTLDGNGVMGIGANNWGTGGVGPKLSLLLTDGDAESYIFESDIYFEGSGVTSGNSIFDFAFVSATSQYASYKITANDDGETFAAFGYDIPLNTWFNFAVEYFPKDGVANYYLNGRLVYTAECEKTTEKMDYIHVGSAPYIGTHIVFDNMYFGKKLGHLVESDTYTTFNDGDKSIVSNFENKSGSSALNVAELDGEKVLKLDKEKGGEDRVWFRVDKAENATKFVFETKFFADLTNNNNMYFDFMNGTTVTGVYGIMMNNNGTLLLSDYYKHNGVAANSFSDTTYYICGAQWIDIKLIGYVNGSNSWNVEIWINGTLMKTSTSTNWTGTKATDINGVRFRTFSALEGDIYFDDVKASQIAE